MPINKNMKLVCECGNTVEFIDGEDGSEYTEDEGFYKKAKGTIEISQGHYQIYIVCKECGAEIWIFT